VGIREEGGRYLAEVLKKKIGLKELRFAYGRDAAPTGVERASLTALARSCGFLYGDLCRAACNTTT